MNKLKMNAIRQVYKFSNENGIDFKQVIRGMADDDRDFNVDGYRFIHVDDIDDIQQEELSSDLYILGCFNASFLSDISNIDFEVFEALQETDNYHVAGKLVLPYIKELQEEYSRIDGYGHHFAHYDHEKHDVADYYAFRVN
jgi:hypothetical protein